MQGEKSREKLIEDLKRMFPGGVLTCYAPPRSVAFVPEYGKGSKLYDVDQNEYLDYMCGQGVLLLGNAHPSVNEAVKEQIDKGSWLRVFPSKPTIELADKIIKAVPCAQKIAFMNSGAEATFYALRASRAFTRKDKILKFEGGYHGFHDWVAMSISPKKLIDFPSPIPESAGIPECVLNEVLIAPFNDLEKTEEIIEKNKDVLAAVIVEPIQRSIPPKTGFLEGLREITKLHGICLIFDEVVTGFRIALGGAQEYYGVVPDLATYGKAIGGGYPIGVLCGKREIMDLFDPFDRAPNYAMLSGTLSGNPISSTAGLAVLAEMEKPGAYEKLNGLGERLRSSIREIIKSQGITAQVTGEGSIWHVYFTEEEVFDFRSGLKADNQKLTQFHTELIRNRILPIYMTKGYLSTAHSTEDIDKTLNIIEHILSKMH